MKRYSVLLADDHEVVLEGLRRMLDHPEFLIAGTVHDGRTLLEAASALDPDIIVLDVAMPRLNGIDAMRQLKRVKARAKVIFFSVYPEVSMAADAIASGAMGYLLKTAGPDELIQAIHDVLAGKVHITAAIDEPVRHALARMAHQKAGENDTLTPRKREILQLLAEGRQVKEIATLLNISPRTVEFHKYGIMEALGAHSVADLARYATRHGIVE